MKILFLSHNIPYPPNKGEKIRAYHFLKHLTKTHEVHLYSLVKDKEDLRYEDDLLALCSKVRLFTLNRVFSKVKSLLCILSPYPMTFGFYYSFWLRQELKKTKASESYDVVFAYCSSMGQYLSLFPSETKILDFVDIDSEKWKAYASYESFPMSWLYKLEHVRLRTWEGILSKKANYSLVTTAAERKKLGQIQFTSLKTSHVVKVGVTPRKTEVYKPDQNPSLVFVGQMDYLPNIDAVIYFYLHILPIIKKEVPEVVFKIVGRNPSPRLIEICDEAEVTGEVDSVEPYLKGSSVFVAPLRLAFGVQTKVLEAMAIGIPVVTTSSVANGLEVSEAIEVEVADNPVDFARLCVELIDDRVRSKNMTERAKDYISKYHDWDTILDEFLNIVETSSS